MGDENRVKLPLVWVLGCALVAVFFTRDALLTDHGIIDRSVVWGRDFINVWTGGHLIAARDFTTLYDPHAYAAYQRGLFGGIDPHNYSYPPVSYPIAALLALLPYPVALVIWQVAGAAFFAAAARPWWPGRPRWWWLAALTPAALVNIWAGHYGFFVGGLFLLGWRALDAHPGRAGMFFGLMLIKPHLALLVPLALLLRGEWRAIAAAAATVTGLIGVTTLIYGWSGWQGYLFGTLGYQATMIDAGGKFFGLLSTSMLTAVHAAGAPWALALGLQIASAVLGLALVVMAARRASTRDLALLVATCTFLVLPYAFAYDLTVVAIGALTLLARPRLPALDQRLAMLGFVGPQVGVAAAIVSLPLLPFMLAGQAVAQFRSIGRDDPAGPKARSTIAPS